MAETSVTKQNKHEQVSDEESDKATDSKNDLDFPLEKLNLGPRKKLIVLCLGGLLVDRVQISTNQPWSCLILACFEKLI